MKNDTLKKLKAMRLPAFAEAYEKQIAQESDYESISFHERLMLLVDANSGLLRPVLRSKTAVMRS